MADGVLVDPFLIEKRDIGRCTEPVHIGVRGGFVTSVDGGREAETLRRMLDEADRSAHNIAEFALGTNRWCRIRSCIRIARGHGSCICMPSGTATVPIPSPAIRYVVMRPSSLFLHYICVRLARTTVVQSTRRNTAHSVRSQAILIAPVLAEKSVQPRRTTRARRS